MRLTRISLLLILIILLSIPGLAASLKVHILDVGQGDAILAQFPTGETMLIDAGGASAGPIVVKYLKAQGIKRIDILVASHPHEDHIGGMPAVFNAFMQIGKVWDSGYSHGSQIQHRFLETIKQRHLQYGKPKAGFTQSIGKVRIDVLAPGHQPITGIKPDANNNSLVLRLVYEKVSFLLTGDMEEEERAKGEAWPQSTVLKIAHHGSRNGTDEAFLKQVAPLYGAISCAKQNAFGHPHKETLQALAAAKVKLLTTPTYGTITFTTDGKTIRWMSTRAPSPSTNTTTTAGKYIGNKNSQIFHLPSCTSLPKGKNRVYFASRQEAINAGYRPCKRCDP